MCCFWNLVDSYSERAFSFFLSFFFTLTVFIVHELFLKMASRSGHGFFIISAGSAWTKMDDPRDSNWLIRIFSWHCLGLFFFALPDGCGTECCWSSRKWPASSPPKLPPYTSWICKGFFLSHERAAVPSYRRTYGNRNEGRAFLDECSIKVERAEHQHWRKYTKEDSNELLPSINNRIPDSFLSLHKISSSSCSLSLLHLSQTFANPSRGPAFVDDRPLELQWMTTQLHNSRQWDECNITEKPRSSR